MRTATSIHSAVAAAVTKKLNASPAKPSSSTGRRPKRSDSAPRIGELTKLAMPKVNVTARKASVCSSLLCVNCPTMCGSTGTIRPMLIMSISTATR